MDSIIAALFPDREEYEKEVKERGWELMGCQIRSAPLTGAVIGSEPCGEWEGHWAQEEELLMRGHDFCIKVKGQVRLWVTWQHLARFTGSSLANVAN